MTPVCEKAVSALQVLQNYHKEKNNSKAGNIINNVARIVLLKCNKTYIQHMNRSV